MCDAPLILHPEVSSRKEIEEEDDKMVGSVDPEVFLKSVNAVRFSGNP